MNSESLAFWLLAAYAFGALTVGAAVGLTIQATGGVCFP